MDEQELQTTNEQQKPDYLWLLCCALITAVAAFVRFFWLEIKPLHHDEGVNGYFLTTLFRTGEYKYDPQNYHGPDLYYIALAFTKTFGLTTWGIRASVAIFGVLVVVLAFYLKKHIGKIGSLFAALFLALSPGMAYISRYFIHEMLFVFLSFGIAVSILFFIEKRKAGIGAIVWTALLLLVCFLPSALNLAGVLENVLKTREIIGADNVWVIWTLSILFFLVESALVFFVIRMLLGWRDGQPIYLILASASAVLLFATKETAFITIGTMAIAAVSVFHWRTLVLVETKLPAIYYRAALILLALGGIVNFLFFKNSTVYKSIGALLVVFIASWIFASVWRKYNSVESAPKNLFRIFTAASVIGLSAIVLSVLFERWKIYDGFEEFSIYQGLKTLRDNFAAAKDPAQMTLFYGILAFGAVSAIVWLAFLVINRRRAETELADDPQLNWTNFREQTTAADTWEFLLVKSAFGGAVIVVVWLFVRYGIDLLIAWKSDKLLSAAFAEIALGKIDAAILGIAVFCFAAAAFLRLWRKPQKISTDLVLIFTALTLVFLYVGALFFSSFFTYPEGLKGAFKAYAFWTKTGKTDHTQNGFWAYVRWGMIIESPILMLSALGTLIAVFKARHRFAMFAGFWAFGLFAAYTLIPYKTPWLALSFLLPMCIVAGYAVNELVLSKNVVEKISGGVLAVAASGILAFQTYDINFVRYDSDLMPYIYAHTKRGFLDLVKQIEHYAGKSKLGKQAKIEIISPDYWSMPWYMNDYPNAVFEGKPVDANSAEMIVAKKGEQDAEIVSRYGVRYKYAGEYPLRPGVDLILLVRSDLADSNTQDIYSIFGEPLTITPLDESQPETPLDDEAPKNEKH